MRAGSAQLEGRRRAHRRLPRGLRVLHRRIARALRGDAERDGWIEAMRCAGSWSRSLAIRMARLLRHGAQPRALVSATRSARRRYAVRQRGRRGRPAIGRHDRERGVVRAGRASLLRTMARTMREHPLAAGRYLSAIDFYLGPVKEVASPAIAKAMTCKPCSTRSTTIRAKRHRRVRRPGSSRRDRALAVPAGPAAARWARHGLRLRALCLPAARARSGGLRSS